MENNGTITLRKTLCPNPQRGRCICFRTFYPQLDYAPDVVSFYSIPFDFFGDGGDDDDVNPSDPDVEVLLPFCTTTALSRFSRLSSVGSSLFVVDECKGLRTYKGILHRIDTTAPADGWSAIPMLVPRQCPLTVVMDGKLYVFGGNDLCAPLAELFDPRLVPSTFLPLHPPPCFPRERRFNLVIAALQPSKKILVALADVALVFNVVDQVWEELDHKVDFSRVRGRAAVFRNGTALCWCSKDGKVVHVYDLVLKRWFNSHIEGLDKICCPEPGLWRNCQLFPLDDNHLGLLWQEGIHYCDTALSLFHCSKIRVSIYSGARGESRFDAVAVVSRSYALLGQDELLMEAHVFLGEEDEGGERGSGLVGHDHGSWERCGYGSGRRTASSISLYKECSKCLLPRTHRKGLQSTLSQVWRNRT